MNRMPAEQLRETGIVIAALPAEGDQPARARVRLEVGDHCEHCAAKILCKPEDGDRRVLECIDEIGVSAGQRVQVMVPGGEVLKASALVWGMPLLLLVAGISIGWLLLPQSFPGKELWCFLLGAGLALGSLFVLRISQQRRGDASSLHADSLLKPQIVGVL